ncbi:MAG: cytochrome b/b6 domain-containing protein [Alphaproteobacteria bacterium]
MHRIRVYHTVLVVSVVLAYLTGDWGLIHAWLGYAVAAIIVLRVLTGFLGVPQLGLMRFYPQFEGLKLGNAATHPAISRTLLAGIAACLIGATVTGIAMDRGHAIGIADGAVVTTALADDDGSRNRERARDREHREDGGLLGEAHEVLANWLMVIVALHVSYLLLFKRPLALFMIFADARSRRR